ncbi:MAG: 2-nitropropane dioxygenase, partial [Myxococcaceae bacterium]|nr:2-nitropropane dioxygenase [Myxococcaceae bacterium]
MAVGMWNDTAFTRRFGLRYPIVQGPFGGGASSVALAAAVSNAGGLGSFGAHALAPAAITRTVAELRARTDRPFNLNLWVPLPEEAGLRFTPASFEAALALLRPYLRELGAPEPAFQERAGQDFDAQIAAVLVARPPVLSFVFGAPSPAVMAALRERGILTVGAATTVDEARHIEAAGFDAVVASGSDAGGHRPTFLRPAEESLTGTFSLVPQVVDAVRIPVIAAGGVADARGVAAALALGAAAAQLGTAFLACDESNASEGHKRTLVSPDARWTTLTRLFSGRHARGVRNRLITELRAHEADVPPYPLQNWLTQGLRAAAGASGHPELQSLWSGQAAGLVRRRAAADLMAALVAALDAPRP